MKRVFYAGSILILSMYLSACASHGHHQGSAQPSVSSVSSQSLAYAYTYKQLVHKSDVIALVQIQGIDHVDKQRIMTFYNAKVLDVYKKGTEPATDLVLQQMGYKSKDGSVAVEDHAPFQKGEKAVLFLTRTKDHTYKITGADQGRFDVANGKIHSLYQGDGMQLDGFRKMIETLIQKQG